ncbi:MAG TPA: hypothetical protein VJC12_03645 [Candidatus Paceibacterota bacterium]
MLAIAVGVLAGIVQLAGYWVYNRTAKKPSSMSWFIWGIGSLITFYLYSELVQDWVKEFLPFVCMLAAFATFIVCAIRRKFDWPDRMDVAVLGLDVLVVAYWFLYREATWANLLLQIDVAISFIPQFRGVWRNPDSEDWKPWLIWSVAYLLLLTTVLMKWESWWELLYPINYFLLHVSVFTICKYRTVK